MPPSCMTGIKYDDRHLYDMIAHHRWRMQKKIMGLSVEETAAKHERTEASACSRERGFENVSVAEVMKAAGLTHGRSMPISPRRKNCRRLPLPTAKKYREADRKDAKDRLPMRI